MSLAGFASAYLLLGIAAWLADFYWSPGKLEHLYGSVTEEEFGGPLPAPALRWVLAFVVDLVMSTVTWPALIYALIMRAIDDDK